MAVLERISLRRENLLEGKLLETTGWRISKRHRFWLVASESLPDYEHILTANSGGDGFLTRLFTCERDFEQLPVGYNVKLPII